jgi:hypothetical protein
VEIEERLGNMNLHDSENKMAQRPGFGKDGRPVKLRANYLKVVQVSKDLRIPYFFADLLTRDFR